MSLRIGKALVVDGDERTRSAANSLLLSSARQPFDYAGSLVEAVELLKANNYVCVFLAGEIPAMPGVAPRRQDTENFMEEMDSIKGEFRPPVVCMWYEMSDISLDNFVCWVNDMTLKGVVKWVPKPFPSSGRTPDRMLKKLLNGQYVRLVKAAPLTPAALMAAPLQADSQPGGAENRQAATEQGSSECAACTASRRSAGCVADKMDGPALTSKLKKIVDGMGGGKDDLLSALCQDATRSAPKVPPPETKVPAKPAVQDTPPSPESRWPGIPNEPIEIDEFMAKFCEQRTKQARKHRKDALLAAARHKTVTLPPLGAPHKHGQAKKYLVHDLLAAWQGYLDEGVDLPPLLP